MAEPTERFRWNVADLGGQVASLTGNGASGNGTTDDRAILATVDAKDAPMFLDPGKTFSVQSDITLTGKVDPRGGGILKPASGVTITIDGPVHDPGPIQWIDLSAGGAVAGLNRARAVWFLGDDADGTTDNNAVLQAALNGAPGRFIFDGNHSFLTSATLTSAASVIIEIEEGANLKHTGAQEAAIQLDHAFSFVEGAGEIESTGAYYSTDAATEFGVVTLNAAMCRVKDVQMLGIPHAGVACNVGAEGWSVTNVYMDGEIPVQNAFPAGFGTSHAGVIIRPTNAGKIGGRMSGCTVENVISGALFGTYVSATFEGMAFDSNLFANCYDHAIYLGNGARACSLTNNISMSARGFDATGDSHTIVGNVVYTTEVSSNVRRNTGSITLRDATKCVVSSNVVEVFGNSQALIELRNLSSTDPVEGNLVALNDLRAIGGPATGVRIRHDATGGQAQGNDVLDNVIELDEVLTGGAAVLVQSDTAPSRPNRVKGNRATVTFEGAATGFYGAAAHTRLTDNILVVEGAASVAVTCSGFRGGDYAEIERNEVWVDASQGGNVTLRSLNIESTTGASMHDNRLRISATASLAAHTPTRVTSATGHTRSKTRKSNDAMAGTATISSGNASVTITNANAGDGNLLLLTPTNQAAGQLMASPGYYVTETADTSYVIQTGDGTNAPSDCTFGWRIA